MRNGYKSPHKIREFVEVACGILRGSLGARRHLVPSPRWKDAVLCEKSQSRGADIVPLFDDVLPFRKGLLAMLKVYLDFGKKSDATDGIVCVASVVFKRTPYKQFLRPWNRMLKAWGASAFHATDFYPGAQEFVRDTPQRKQLFAEDAKRIPSMIGDHVQRILMVSFRPDEFNQLAPPKWKAKFGTSVHSHAVQLTVISNGWWRHEKCRHESFAYFMETGDTDQGEVVKTVERMRAENETSKVIRIASFTPVDKGMARGLEAADFAAWHWNKHYMDKIRTGKHTDPRKDFAALEAAAPHKIDILFATGDKLKYFFSVVPPEILEA